MSIGIASLNNASSVSSLFSRIDTKNQGYIEKSDLKTAFDQVSSEDNSEAVDKIFSKLDADNNSLLTEHEMVDGMEKLAAELHSQFNQSRVSRGGEDAGFTQEELTSMIERVGDSDSEHTALMQNIVDNFDAADTDGDGRVTFSEAIAYDQSTQSGEAESAVVAASMNVSGSSDTGYTQDELLSLIEEIGDTDTRRTDLMQSIVDNFDTADVDGDGTVTHSEAMAYDQSVNGTEFSAMEAGMPPPPPPPGAESSDSTTYSAADMNEDGTVSLEELMAYYGAEESGTSSESNDIMKTMAELMVSYGLTDMATSGSNISVVA